MDIEITEAQGRVPVTIMQLRGELDATNYRDAIATVREVYAAGARDLILDLSDLSFMASSGLVALHSIALIMRGEEPPDPEYGWSAFRSVSKQREQGPDPHCRICNPQPAVDRTLEMTGFKTFLEVHSDVQMALAAF